MESKESVKASGKYRSRGAWLEHVSNWQASGLSQADYARAHGLTKSGLNLWIKRARQGAASLGEAKQPSIQLVSVKLPTPLSAPPLVLRGGAGWELKVPSGIDVQWLGQLLGQLA